MLEKTLLGRTAMLAIMFAAGMTDSQIQALATQPVDEQVSVMQSIAGNRAMQPEVRAYYLLQLAKGYLQLADIKATQDRFRFAGSATRLSRRWDDSLVALAEAVYSKQLAASSDSSKTSAENIALANEAIENSITQLEKSPNKFETLLLYFTASSLSKQAGDRVQATRFDLVLSSAIKCCEQLPFPDEQEVRGVTTILNIKANRIIPVRIPERFEFGRRAINGECSFKTDDYLASEKLKLQAAALADRLPATTDLRRRVHRDLTLWYELLGKTDKSEEQKQILFELVGSNNDRILYPQNASCGHLIWWQEKPVVSGEMCGMG